MYAYIQEAAKSRVTIPGVPISRFAGFYKRQSGDWRSPDLNERSGGFFGFMPPCRGFNDGTAKTTQADACAT